MKLSIRAKFGILILIFITVMTGAKFMTSWVNAEQKDMALYINLAGRQRMLSQKMTKEALAISRELASVEGLRRTAAAFLERKRLLSGYFHAGHDFKPDLYSAGLTGPDDDKRLTLRHVSTRPRNPANTPDAFEEKTLELFDEETDTTEYYNRSTAEDGTMSLRYMLPLIAEKGCLNCHGSKDQVIGYFKKGFGGDPGVGYSTGDLIGALSLKYQTDGAAVDLRGTLDSTRNLFDKTLKGLTRGGETTGTTGSTVTLVPIADQGIKEKLTEATAFWQGFNKMVGEVMDPEASADSSDFINAMAFIEANSLKLLSEMNVITGLYQKHAEEKSGLLEWIQLATLVVILLGSLLAFMGISRLVISPLERIRDNLNAFATGRLSVKELEVRANDEIGGVAKTVNTMTSSIKAMINGVRGATNGFTDLSGDIKKATDELALATSAQGASVKKVSTSMDSMDSSIADIAKNTNSLSATAEEVSSSTLEITASIDEVAKISEDLSLTVEEVSSSISEMAFSVKEISEHTSLLSSYANDTATSISEINASIKEVEGNIKSSAHLSEATAADAGEGREAVIKTTDAMERINETVDEVAGVIRRFVDKAASVGNILSVINEMAEQTNLLSLNAAIIAAQAGEQGKGFAVVADEIKDFSDKTASSTKQIEKLIKSVQIEAGNAVKSVENVGKSVEDGVTLSHQAAEALDKILSSANGSSQMIEQIAKASAEQLKGSQQVTESMEKISEMVRKVYRAIEDQEKGSSYIAKAAEQMMDSANQARRATKEQARGGELIARGIENISGMLNTINKSTQEQARGSRAVIKTIDEVRLATEKNNSSVKTMRDAAEMLTERTETLVESVKKFHD